MKMTRKEFGKQFDGPSECQISEIQKFHDINLNSEVEKIINAEYDDYINDCGAYVKVSSAVNKVLRNTYLLLSMTLLFSAVMAGVSMLLNAQPMGIIGIICVIGLIFAIHWKKDSWIALPLTFAFTGLMGFFTGPLVGMYLELANGPEIVMGALGTTFFIFFSLSGYALTTKKDFSFIGAFLFTGLLVLFGAMILSMFVNISGLQMAISVAAVLLFSGYILYDTSRIIHGGETNYVLATVSLYLDVLNIFVHLLQIFGVISRD